MRFIERHPPTPTAEALNTVAPLIGRPLIGRPLIEGRNAAGMNGVPDGRGSGSCRTGPPFLEIMLGNLVETTWLARDKRG